MVPTEQAVLSLMGDDNSIEPVADLLTALGYPDVARELRRLFDEIDDREEPFI